MKHCRPLHWLVRCALTLAMCSSTAAWSASIGELLAAGHLQIDSSLAPATGVVPGQKITLNIEIATDRWFTGGTRFTLPEVPGLVILQTEQFATNSSESRNGQTWVIQRWTLDVYPQRAGDFTIDPIAVQVQVNAEGDGDTAGELHSPAQQFAVTIPASLEPLEHWVAAPSFTVSQNFDKPLDQLAVGDAFEQEVLFEAADVLAMMLPQYQVEQQSGLADYAAPVELNNSVNRGQSLATRRLRISYVAEQPGEFLLPEREFYWWNTLTSKLELLSVPETRINVTGTAVAASKKAVTAMVNPRQLLLLVLGLIALALLLRLAMVYLPRLPLARVAGAFSTLRARWRALRQPALAERLNPGNSAAD